MITLSPHIHYYTQTPGDIQITEFAHSRPDQKTLISPYVRNVYLLHIVIKGVCKFCDFDAPEGSVFLISKNKLHSFSVEPEYEHYWFGFDGDGVTALFRQYNIQPNSHQLFQVHNFDFLKVILQNAMVHAKNQANIALSTFHAIFPLLICGENAKEVLADLTVVAKNFIEKNYQNQITMGDVARHVCVSEKYLCHRFKNAFQITPQHYLLSVRIKKAERLLRTTGLKINEISASVGYRSQLTFSSAFKNKTGYSPSKFREIYQNYAN